MAMLLDVKNINVYYGAIHAVKDISFQVEEGEIVTLIGANGAGKSTTLQTISGLLHTRTGSIEFMGKSIHGVPAHKLVAQGLAQELPVQDLDVGVLVREADAGGGVRLPEPVPPRARQRLGNLPR